MGVEIERHVHATFQSLIHDEVQPMEMVEFEPLNITFQQCRERLFQPFGRNLHLDRGIICSIKGKDADIGAIAFVTSPGMSDFVEGNGWLHVSIRRKVG